MGGIFAVLMVLWGSTVVFANGRQKRVVHGIIITDRDGPSYSVIKYFVWIGHHLFVDPYRGQLVGNLGRHQMCGGALLTPTIVQSACHCFAHFRLPTFRGSHGYLQPAVKKGEMCDVVVGHSDMDQPGIRPLAVHWYIIHPSCGRVTTQWLNNDFALLVLQKEVQLSANVKVAPVYPLADMVEMWKRVTLNENMCLLIGFGRYIDRRYGQKSRVLRHGWQVMMKYRACYYEYRTRIFSFNITRYQEIMTVSCIKPFRQYSPPHLGGDLTYKLRTLLAGGDSGSPLTCDNMYFGLNSGHEEDTFERKRDFGIIDDLMYYAYANSLEYRPSFLAELRASPILPPPRAQKDHTFKPDYLIHPDPPPPNFFAPITSESAKLPITSSSFQSYSCIFSLSLAIVAITR